MERTQSAVDKLVGTPLHVLHQASHLTMTCQEMPGLGSDIKSVVQSIFDDMIAHEAKQQEFLTVRLGLKDLVKSMKSQAETSIAAGAIVMVDLYPQYNERLVSCLSMLDNLILGAKSLLDRFQGLQSCIDVPSTLSLRKFVTEQLATYRAFHEKYSKRANHNSCRWRDSPGAEFGLKPFEEIMFAWDGTLMVWDEEFGDWGWLEHYHPCRYVPGSDWGKFYHDLTHGDFWVHDRRPIVDWVHAAPAKAIVGHIEAEYRRVYAAMASEGQPSVVTAGSTSKNKRLATSTGIDYPVCDDERLMTTTFNIDLRDVTTSQFAQPPGDVPRLEELSNTVKEVITGEVPEVAAMQEHVEMIYRLG